MTIPEYDQECDCDLCTTLRNDRIKASKEKHAQRNHTSTPDNEFRCKQCGQFSEECECEEPTSPVKIMTPHIDVEYIITESKLVKLQGAFHKQSIIDFFDIINQVFDTPRRATPERDKVLKELKKDLQSRFISSINQWSKGRNSGLLECCNIIDEYLTTFAPEQI